MTRTSSARTWSARTRRRVILVAIAAATVAAVVVGVVVVRSLAAPSDVTVTASSTSMGTDALEAWRSDVSAPSPSASPSGPAPTTTPAADSDGGTSSSVWQSVDETDGAWLRVQFASPRAVDRVRIDGSVPLPARFHSALVDFDGLGAVLVTADDAGFVDVTIAERVVSTVSIRFLGTAEDSTAIGIHGFQVDGSGASLPDAAAPTWRASSGDAARLHDGDLSQGSLGEDWAGDRDGAWIAAEWDTRQPVSAFTVVGSGRADEPRGGSLVFSDGSSVVVSGIGDGEMTTIAFATRMVTWVRLDLDDGAAGLSEADAVLEGRTPAVLPALDRSEPYDPSESSCEDTPRPSGEGEALTLLCPESGAAVTGDQLLVVRGPADSPVTAVVEATGLSDVVVGRGVIDDDGRAVLRLAAGALPDGPFGMRIDSAGLESLHLSLVGSGEPQSATAATAPAGMTLQYEDEFDDPLSVSRGGAGAQYAAIKPSAEGNSQFGEAAFPDPADGLDTLVTTHGVLRIRVQPATEQDEGDRESVGGILSSAREDGSGFAAQYGYYQARMLVPAGEGTWPAFWMLDTEGVVRDTDAGGEVDAAEMYGHDVTGVCHSIHNWVDSNGDVDPSTECAPIAEAVDTALEWHVFGARVLPGRVDYYVDGELVRTLTGLQVHETPYFFLLDLALGGGWPVDLSATDGIADLYVDWVRVYT